VKNRFFLSKRIPTQNTHLFQGFTPICQIVYVVYLCKECTCVDCVEGFTSQDYFSSCTTMSATTLEQNWVIIFYLEEKSAVGKLK
jgi:hypothetical protein